METYETSGTATKANQPPKLICPEASGGSQSRCGGKLEWIGKVEAGQCRGIFFDVYKCQRCGKVISVGGS